jgi:hypothetical protein
MWVVAGRCSTCRYNCSTRRPSAEPGSRRNMSSGILCGGPLSKNERELRTGGSRVSEWILLGCQMLSISQPAFFTSAGRLVQHVPEAVPWGGVELNHLFVLGDLPLPIFPARLHVANSSRDIPRYRFVLRGVPLETDFSRDQFVLRVQKYCHRIHNGFIKESYWIHQGLIMDSHTGFILES